MLLNTAENCTPQTLLTTEADRQGRMDQAGPAGGRFHTHNPTHLRGGGAAEPA